MTETIAYKVLTAEEWHRLERNGLFDGSRVDLDDGFIHLSTASQLTETVDKHFSGQTGLIVLAVDLTLLGPAVRWERSRGGQLFPHIYGPLPRNAVAAHGALERLADGSVRRP